MLIGYSLLSSTKGESLNMSSKFFQDIMLSFIILMSLESQAQMNKMKSRKPSSTNSLSNPVPAESSPLKNERSELDRSVYSQLNQDQVSSVFRDMVVVQRKAKEKGKKFLLAPSLSFEFSDGPKAMYPINLDIGYAFNDFWELYVNYVPSFLVRERSIVSKVKELKTASGDQASISASNPQSQVGVNLLWVPAYGKDSWGPYSIIRSDTFFKFGLANIKYEDGSGLRISALVGKTYFIASQFNLRLAVGGMNVESFSTDSQNQKKKNSDTVAIIESGIVFYF